MANVRKTGGRLELDAIISGLNLGLIMSGFRVDSDAGVGNGTTVGFARTNTLANFVVHGFLIGSGLASTDDFWDLTGEAVVPANHHRAYFLMASDVGAAVLQAGPDVDTTGLGAAAAATAARDALVLDTTLDSAVIGTYVADPGNDFTGALATSGTFDDGTLALVLDRLPIVHVAA